MTKQNKIKIIGITDKSYEKNKAISLMAFKYLLFATTSNSIEEDKHKTHSEQSSIQSLLSSFIPLLLP